MCILLIFHSKIKHVKLILAVWKRSKVCWFNLSLHFGWYRTTYNLQIQKCTFERCVITTACTLFAIRDTTGKILIQNSTCYYIRDLDGNICIRVPQPIIPGYPLPKKLPYFRVWVAVFWPIYIHLWFPGICPYPPVTRFFRVWSGAHYVGTYRVF